MHQCCINGCPQEPVGPTFPIPAEGSLREEWLDKINSIDLQNAHICWLHFRLDDFAYQSSPIILQPPKELLPGAVPSVFPWSADWVMIWHQHCLISSPVWLDSFTHFMDLDSRRQCWKDVSSSFRKEAERAIPGKNPPVIDLASPADDEGGKNPVEVVTLKESSLPGISSSTSPAIPCPAPHSMSIYEKKNKMDREVCPDCGFGPMMGLHVCISKRIIDPSSKSSSSQTPRPKNVKVAKSTKTQPEPIGLRSCQHCPFVATNAETLKFHERYHAVRSTFQCPSCSYSSNSEILLKYHLYGVHRNENKKTTTTMMGKWTVTGDIRE